MANIPEELSYTKDHEWIRVKGDIATIGITDHAQKQLGDVTYVELPKVGDHFEATEPFATVESVKAASEVYMPVTGKVIEINESLNEVESDLINPINEDPYGDGWMVIVKMENPAQVDRLLSAIEYEDYVKEEASE